MAIAVFCPLADRWDNAITTGISGTVSSALQANATLLASLLTLYVIIVGGLTAFGAMSWSEFVRGVIRAAFISLLLTATYFNQWIQTPAMETIPQWIAQTVNGDDSITSTCQQFDRTLANVVARQALILREATGLSGIGYRIQTAMITWFIFLELDLTFLLWEMARGLMGLLVATAPFLIGLVLFDAMRQYAMNLAGQAITVLIMQLMLAIMIAIAVVTNQGFITSSITAGGGIDEQIAALGLIAVFFGFSLGMIVFVPIVAGRIGGGVMPAIGGMVGGPLRWMSGSIGGKGR